MPWRTKLQIHTVPSERSAADMFRPAQMPTTPETPATCTGVDRGVVVPSPSWLWSLAPQPQTVPSERSASEYWYPAATAVTLSTPRTTCGVE
jgi:hypothetical protein